MEQGKTQREYHRRKRIHLVWYLHNQRQESVNGHSYFPAQRKQDVPQHGHSRHAKSYRLNQVGSPVSTQSDK